MWGTDWTRAVALLTYRQGVDAFRVTERLSDSEKSALMGGTLQRVYGWTLARDGRRCSGTSRPRCHATLAGAAISAAARSTVRTASGAVRPRTSASSSGKSAQIEAAQPAHRLRHHRLAAERLAQRLQPRRDVRRSPRVVSTCASRRKPISPTTA